jgi:hypothetical protein
MNPLPSIQLPPSRLRARLTIRPRTRPARTIDNREAFRRIWQRQRQRRPILTVRQRTIHRGYHFQVIRVFAQRSKVLVNHDRHASMLQSGDNSPIG